MGRAVVPAAGERVAPTGYRLGFDFELGFELGFGAAFRTAAARTSAVKAVASIRSPSCRSIARRTLPSRLALNSRDGVGQGRPLGERQLHRRLVGLAGAEDAAAGPDRHAPPLPLLDDVGTAAWISRRTWASVVPRQSFSLRNAVVNQLEGDGCGAGAFMSWVGPAEERGQDKLPAKPVSEVRRRPASIGERSGSSAYLGHRLGRGGCLGRRTDGHFFGAVGGPRGTGAVIDCW